MKRKYSPREILRIVGQHRWVVLVPCAIGLALAGPIGAWIPGEFRSEARILAIPQAGPDGAVVAAAPVADRLSTIREQFFSRPALERIAADLKPYAAAADGTGDLAGRMRRDIETQAAESPDAFRLSYVSHDPALAQQVTARLAALFVQAAPAKVAPEAVSSGDLDAEVAAAKARLGEQQQKIEQYWRRQAGDLRTQFQDTLKAMQETQLRLQAVTEQMNEARGRRAELERQVSDSSAAPPAPEQSPLLGAAQQLAVAKAQAQLFKMRLPADHPDVLALEQAVKEIEARVAQEAAAGPAPVRQPQADTPARRRNLETAVAGLDRQIATMRGEEARLKATLLELQQGGGSIGAGGSEIGSLTEEYSALQAAYSGLLARRADSAVSDVRDGPTGGASFSILEPAALPASPANRWRRLAMLGGPALGGLLAGLAMIWRRERRDLSFRRPDEVTRALALPVLTQVPALISDGDRRKQRTRALMMDAAGVAVLLASVASLAYWGS